MVLLLLGVGVCFGVCLCFEFVGLLNGGWVWFVVVLFGCVVFVELSC